MKGVEGVDWGGWGWRGWIGEDGCGLGRMGVDGEIRVKIKTTGSLILCVFMCIVFIR